MKILVSDKLAKEGLDILNAEGSFTVDCQYGLTPQELKDVIKDYDGLIIRSGTNVTADIIESADKLKVIGRAGVGLDNVDLAAATRKGIVAMNTPSGNTTSTAEHTMSMILALSRNIPQAYHSMLQGKWERSKFGGVELYGKTLGVIGFGRIGSTVAKFAQAFEMNVIAYDPFLSIEAIEKRGVQGRDFESLIKEADYITIHIPKTDDTVNLFSDEQFEMMKTSARLINCARGGIIDEAALYHALKENKIAGCALDVYSKEPLAADSPLITLPNCVTTPHLGASTSEAQINVAIEIAECVRDALLGRGIINAANFPSVDASTYAVIEPYISLGAKLGKFSGQLIDGGIKQVTITYGGEIIKHKLTSITLAIVNGLLASVLGDTVNHINALDMAKSRSINIQEVKSNSESEFTNYIRIEIETDKKPFQITGTLSPNKQPRIVKVQDIYVEADPDGDMLVINNNDKPGLVGVLGTMLAEEDINIAGISLGREARDGVAMSIVNIDTQASDACLDRLKKTNDVLFVKQLKV